MAEPQDNAAPGFTSPWGPQWEAQFGPWTAIPTPPTPTPASGLTPLLLASLRRPPTINIRVPR